MIENDSLVCPYLPFPNIYWWSYALGAQRVILDGQEHFEKMSFRNRYLVSSATGPLTLSIPLREGRQQRKAMIDVYIDNNVHWQKQHWKTLKSVYNRSPYFEFFEFELEKIYTNQYEKLYEFSMASIEATSLLLSKKIIFQQAESYIPQYLENTTDIRKDFRSNQYVKLSHHFSKYQQVFEDRLGFLPNLSILDLLFAEGKNSVHLI